MCGGLATNWNRLLRSVAAAVLAVGLAATHARGQEMVDAGSAAAADEPVRSLSVDSGPIGAVSVTEPALPPGLAQGGGGEDALPARVVMGPMDVIVESIFGEASVDNWQPLSLSNFLSKGWDQPFAKSPIGTNGAPRQNWFGSADGIFVRLSSLSFFNTIGMTTNNGLLLTPVPWSPAKPKTNGNAYWAAYQIYVPLNQRMEVLVAVPFIASNSSSPTGHYVGNFGDLTISGRFRLIEQNNFSMQALLTERTPTGKSVNGNDINFVTPSLEFWWNLAPRWVVRGTTGINIDTGRATATSVYFNSLAVGRYLTTTDARVFKDLAVHVAVSTLSDVLGRKGNITDVYVAPGLRFSLGENQNWSILGCVQIPVAGPQPYAWQPMFSLARAY